jgi:hypothetical protein
MLVALVSYLAGVDAREVGIRQEVFEACKSQCREQPYLSITTGSSTVHSAQNGPFRALSERINKFFISMLPTFFVGAPERYLACVDECLSEQDRDISESFIV